MGMLDKIWAGIAKVVKMETKVEGLTSLVKSQQDKIENLNERVIRLEARLDTYVEVASKQKRIEKK